MNTQVIDRLPLVQPGPELRGHATEFVIAHGTEFVLQRVDLIGDRRELAEDLAFAGAKDLVDDFRHATSLPRATSELARS